MKKRNRVFLNKKQQEFIRAPQPTKFWEGGRGTGKSSVEGAVEYECLRLMPRAKTFFSSSTYAQMLTKTLPAMTSMLERHGLKEHINGQQMGHFIIGSKPPKDWPKPFQPPKKYTNVITYINGYTRELLSMDRPDLARGGSYDGGAIDEAYLLKEESFNRVLLPSIRGNQGRWDTPLFQQLRLYFSVPWGSKGQWLYNYEEKFKSDALNYYWMTSKTSDNIDVIGQKAYDRMKRDMNYLEFLVECENQRFTKVRDPYYNSFDDSYHIYNPQFKYGLGDRGVTLEGQKIISDDGPIDAVFDFSGWFNCMTLWQEQSNIAYCIDALDVQDPESIDHLIIKFVSKYADHKMKHLNIYGEYYGHNKRPEGETLYQRIERILNKYGWTCDILVSEPAIDQDQRREPINEFFAETNSRLPKVRFNTDTCKSVMIALNNTKVKHDMKKDKSDEKNRSFNQAHATHYPDTVDYYLLQKYSSRLGNYVKYISRGSRFGFS